MTAGEFLWVFVAGFFFAALIFGKAWITERGKRLQAEKVILKLKKQLGKVLTWR